MSRILYPSEAISLPRPQLLPGWLATLTLLLLLAWFMPPSFGIIICSAVAVYAVLGIRQSGEALVLLAFLLIIGKTDVALGRWIILFAAFGRGMWDTAVSRLTAPPLNKALLLFGGIMVAFSAAFSTMPVVSVLKVLSFVVGVSAALLAFYRTRKRVGYWWSVIFTLAVFTILASVPLYGMPEGYARNDVGFQGILTHPQTFGPVVAVLTAFLSGLIVFREERSWLVVSTALLGWVGVYFSLARTALLALLLSLLVVFALGLVARHIPWRDAFVRVRLLLSKPLVILLLVGVGSVVLVQSDTVRESAEAFLQKDGDGGGISQILERSRGVLMSRSMNNFRQEPLTGIGFGVPSDPQGARRIVDGPLGIPVSASVEKGFMPTAVLEEVGIVGAFLVVGLLLFLFMPAIKQREPTIFWIMACCLFINFGEMVFFSVGGMGFFFWVMLSLGYVSSIHEQELCDHRVRDRERQKA